MTCVSMENYQILKIQLSGLLLFNVILFVFLEPSPSDEEAEHLRYNTGMSKELSMNPRLVKNGECS